MLNFLDNWALANAKNRHAFVKEWIAGLPPGSSILDAGAGMERYRPFAAHLRYTSQDFGVYEGGEMFGGLRTGQWNSRECDIICDIGNIPVADSYFDYVLCTEVFEHLPNPGAALIELSRILKPGGQMLLTAPFRSLYHQAPYYYYSGFSRFWYHYWSGRAGLSVELISANGSYRLDIAQEVMRSVKAGGLIHKIIANIASLPYLLYLYAMEKGASFPAPESCWGYHVILSK